MSAITGVTTLQPQVNFSSFSAYSYTHTGNTVLYTRKTSLIRNVETQGFVKMLNSVLIGIGRL